MAKRYLILDDGTVFEGEAFGAEQESCGELVFTTGMAGYQEAITDPAYAGQLVVFTYPTVGNYGLNPDDDESFYSGCQGVIVYDWARQGSNWRQTANLDTYLKNKGIPGIAGLDTRALTRLIRTRGLVKAQLVNSLDNKVVGAVATKDLVASVSTKTTYALPGAGRRVVVLDLGVKQSLLKTLKGLDWQVTVVPWHTPVESILALAPSGLIVSSGPGQPNDLTQVVEVMKTLQDKLPILGIGLGHQLLALASGAVIDRLAVGHRGSNHAVRHLKTGQVTFTQQNHSYTVSDTDLPQQLEVTARHLNDGSIQGICHRYHPVMGVQYDPTTQVFTDWEKSMTAPAVNA